MEEIIKISSSFSENDSKTYTYHIPDKDWSFMWDPGELVLYIDSSCVGDEWMDDEVDWAGQKANEVNLTLTFTVKPRK